jgi:hypothetical protein
LKLLLLLLLLPLLLLLLQQQLLLLLLQYDNCYADDWDIGERYTAMRDALNKTRRPI